MNRNRGERLVHLHNLDLVAQLRPAAKHVGIFQGGTAGIFGFPVTQENIMMLSVAVKQVASVASFGNYGREFLKSFQGSGFVMGDGLPDGYREYLLCHKREL